MRIRVVAVGTRMPRWVDEAFADYARRMPRHLAVELIEVRPEPRAEGRPVAAMLQAEATRLNAALPPDCSRIALDERGRDFTTAAFARWLERQTAEGRDVAFLIGGPDGLDASLLAQAQMRLRLSSFTLPHALARVVLAEQLYRASCVLSGHPYHRA